MNTIRITNNYWEELAAQLEDPLLTIVRCVVHTYHTETIPPTLSEVDRQVLRDAGHIYIAWLGSDGCIRGFEVAEFVPNEGFRSFAFLRQAYAPDSGSCIVGGKVPVPGSLLDAVREVAFMRHPSVSGILFGRGFAYEARKVDRLVEEYEKFVEYDKINNHGQQQAGQAAGGGETPA